MGTEAIRHELIEVVGSEIPDLLDSDMQGHIVRLCHDAGTEFHRSLHMVLRSAWLVQKGNGSGNGSGSGITTNDQCSGISEVVKAEKRKRFSPDPIKLFEVFEKNAHNWISGTGYNREMFRLLVAEMVASNLFLYEGKSAEVDHYVDRAHRQKEMLLAESSGGTENSTGIIERLMSVKERWLKCQDELGERLLALEGIRLRNAHINRMWLKIFGAEYVRLIEEESHLEICRRKMLLLDMNPELTAAGLEAKLQQIIISEKRRLDAMRFKASLSLLSDIEDMDREPLDMETLKTYRQDSKKILRDIYLLIHPDLLSQNLAYGNLTENQKVRLMTLWNEVMELKEEEEIGFGPDCLGYHYRSIPILMDKLDLARSILQNAGIDIDPSLIIQGDTLPDQIAWLSRSILSLEVAILSAQAEQKVLLEDEETRERETMLRWTESMQVEIKTEYSRQAEKYRAEVKKFEGIIKDRLAGRE